MKVSLPKLPKLPTLKRKTRKVNWKPVVALALIFAILFVAFYPSSDNPFNIVILHERIEALEEKLSVLSELDASLVSLKEQFEVLDVIVENLLTQQTIINTQVASINAWISGWEAAWNSWLGSFNSWQAQVNSWISGWESYWNSWLAQLGETLENIEAWVTAVETYVYGVSNLLRQIHGAIVPLDYSNVSLAVEAGETVITVVKANLTDTISTTKDIEVRLVNSVLHLFGNNSFSSLTVTGKNGTLSLNCTINFFGRVFLFENLNVSVWGFTLNVFSFPSELIITHCNWSRPGPFTGTVGINHQYSVPAGQEITQYFFIRICNNIFNTTLFTLREKDHFVDGVRYVSRTSGLISGNVFYEAAEFHFYLSGCDHALKVSENCFGPATFVRLWFMAINFSYPATHFQFEGNTILKDHPTTFTSGYHIYFERIELALFVGNLIVLRKISSTYPSYAVYGNYCNKWVFTGNRIGVVADHALSWSGNDNVFVGNQFVGSTSVTGTGNVITGNYGL